MVRPIDYKPPGLLRKINDKISYPILVTQDEGIMDIKEYYNRGRYRFVYRFEDKVMKVFKLCSITNPYYGKFYEDEMKRIRKEDFSDKSFHDPYEKFTYISSLAINEIEKNTYDKAKSVIPGRITDTEYDIGYKVRTWASFYRPISKQGFIRGVPLESLIKDKVRIREQIIDNSYYSQFGEVLDFDKGDKKDILEGIEDFLNLFESFYKEDAILDIPPHNLFFGDKGLECMDLQKFHKNIYFLEQDKSPRDIYHILKGMLEVNQ